MVGEANSISRFLISKCEDLGFGCHVLQLMAPRSKVLEDLVDKDGTEGRAFRSYGSPTGRASPSACTST